MVVFFPINDTSFGNRDRLVVRPWPCGHCGRGNPGLTPGQGSGKTLSWRSFF